MNDRFGARSPDDIRALIDAFPLAWILNTNASGAVVCGQFPLLPLPEASGPVTGLLGHLPRAHPLAARLRDRPRATILFQGPDAYASSSWYAHRDSAPTWLYASIACTADIALQEDLTSHALERLVERMERGRPQRWHLAELGHRRHKLQPRVIAFVATLRQARARFKLAQDESPEAVKNTLSALESHPINPWLRAFNADRLE